MATTHLQRRWSDSLTNPTIAQMRDALRELQTHDPEHPDCWLSDADGWTISVHESGLIVLENVETGEGPWHLDAADHELALTLWQLLQRGDLQTIKQQAWRDGYHD